MKLLVIGINHTTAPIALRERLAFSDDEVSVALRELNEIDNGGINGGVIVSTCNRTEIYAIAPDQLTPNKSFLKQANTNEHLPTTQNDILDITINKITAWLANFKSININQLTSYLYIHRENKALTHWIRVASGLDSMILGEPQILGQIKRSVSRSIELGGVSNKLMWVIDRVFSSAKQIRHDTQVGEQAVTLGYATAKLATQIFDEISDCNLLIVAAGEMNRLVATHIANQGVKNITICNRSHTRAQKLADELAQINPICQIHVRGFSELADCLLEADIVSSCSGSMDSLISYKMVKKSIKKRRYSPMLMVDLAVPRDIEAKVNKIDEVYLYSIDDLQHVIAGNLEQRKQAAVDAEILVSHLVVDIERRYQVKQVGGDIQVYRQNANNHADKLLQTSLKRLENINPQNNETAEQILTDLARQLTQTLTHAPSRLMREVASEGDNTTLDIVVNTLKEAYRK